MKDASITIKSDKTTSDGLYSLKAIKNGTYTVYAEKKGYVPKSSKVTIVPDDESKNNDFTLKPVYEILPESGLNFGADDAKRTLELKNNLDQSLSFSITTGNKWFSIDPLSGNIARNGNSVFVDITLNRTGLTPGSYRGSINVSFGEFGGETYNITFDVPNNDAPTVSSDKPTGQTKTSAEISGTIISIGKGPVTNYGHVWGEIPTPVCCNPGFYTDFKARDKPGAFTSTLAPLTPGKTYFVRAYARNQSGINYSYKEEYSFTTPTTPTPPGVSMGDISLITPTSARAVGKISSNGGDPIIEYGHVWSKIDPTPDPYAAGATKTTFKGEPASAEFTSNLTELEPNSKYYIVAYAKNSTSVNPGKSPVVPFNTPEPIVAAKIITSIATDIGETTATLNGNVTEYGSLKIQDHGFVWSRTNANPELNAKGCDSKSLGNLTKESPISTSVSGLSKGISYYYRAYVKPEGGQPAYSPAVRIFVTKEDNLVYFWTFNSDLSDVSGNGNHAYGTPKTAQDRFGFNDKAIDISSNPVRENQYDRIGITNELTISFWAKLSEANFIGSPKIIYAHSDRACVTAADFTGFYIYFDPTRNEGKNNILFLARDDSTPVIKAVINKNDLNFSKWHHFMIVKSGVIWKFYLDGDLLFSDTFNIGFKLLFSNLSYLGYIWSNCSNDGYGNLNGQIDDVRRYNKAFSDAEVRELYNREKP